MRLDDRSVLPPGPARFDASRGTTSFSFSWARTIPNGVHTLDVQWRVPVASTVILEHGSLHVLSKKGDCA